MASDAKDPREAVLANILHLDRGEVERVSVEVLARLDATDPLRAMLGEVVAELVEARIELAALVPRPSMASEDDWPCKNSADQVCLQAAWDAINRALTRLRTLTPTEGDAQEPEATATRIRDPQFCFEDRLKTGLPCTEPDWRGGNYGSVICRTREHHRNPTEGGTDDGE